MARNNHALILYYQLVRTRVAKYAGSKHTPRALSVAKWDVIGGLESTYMILVIKDYEKQYHREQYRCFKIYRIWHVTGSIIIATVFVAVLNNGWMSSWKTLVSEIFLSLLLGRGEGNFITDTVNRDRIFVNFCCSPSTDFRERDDATSCPEWCWVLLKCAWDVFATVRG